MKSIFRSGRRRPHQHHEEAQQDNATPFFDKKGDRPRSSPFFSQGGATVQAKLAIGQPGDRYEQEADAVADSVVQNQGRGAAPAIQGKGISRIQRVLTAADSDAATADERMEEDKMVQEKPEIQREAAVAEAMAGEEEEPVQMMEAPEEEEPVQMMEAPEEEEPVQMQHDPLSPRLQRAMEEDVQMKAEAGGSTAGPQLSNRIKNSAGKGRPLPGKARAEMELSFGTDFSGVNIHTDTEAMQMNKELGAQAFTHGQDVYFNAGKFSPEHTEGKRLLAHELTHVVQQGGGEQTSDVQRTPGNGHGGKTIERVLPFITLKRNHIHLTGEDKYGHWWTEILTSTKDESFGWWPKYGVGLKDTILGTEGELNGQTTFGGTPIKDPHHGHSGEDVFHPKLTVSKTDDQVVQDIESFAKNYTGEWRWTFGWGQNCHTFQKAMMKKVGLKS